MTVESGQALSHTKSIPQLELQELVNSWAFNNLPDITIESINGDESPVVTVYGTISESPIGDVWAPPPVPKSPSPPLQVSVSRGFSPLSETLKECKGRETKFCKNNIKKMAITQKCTCKVPSFPIYYKEHDFGAAEGWQVDWTSSVTCSLV